MTSDDHPRSLRLAETLVVIALIGVILMLISTLLPRMGSGTPSLRLMCRTNVTQLALATAYYENSHGQYPGYQTSVGGKDATWVVALMPFLERQDVYDLWADKSVPAQPQIEPHIQLFVCPSSTNVDKSIPFNSYVANAGMASLQNEKPANGIFHDLLDGNVVTKAADIRDGTSNTILISENLQAGPWTQVGKQATVFVWHPTTTPRPVHLINGEKDTARLSSHSARPSSHHRGGVNVGFCDKHTMYLSQDIDYKVYMQLMTPDGANSDMPEPFKAYELRDSDYQQ